MRPERQLGLLCGGVALLMVALSPFASRISTVLPACPLRTLVGLPCLTCGSTRSVVALAKLDIVGAFITNPLFATAGVLVVAGGLVAGVLTILGLPIREPDWRLSTAGRWLLGMVLLANWVYLLGAEI